jgi:endonuclease G
VKVPTYLYKLVYDATTQGPGRWQENRKGETVGRPISHQELVKRTGVEFLPRSALQY